MILGIGVDSVEIDRFTQWSTKNTGSLQRIFTMQEITYCLSVPAKSAERFAVRFAAREAFFKTLSSTLHQPIPFLSVCTYCHVIQHHNGAPSLQVDWTKLAYYVLPSIDYTQMVVHLSLTHTRTTATAFVVIEGHKRFL